MCTFRRRHASPIRALFATAAVAGLAAILPAQRPFEELRKHGLPWVDRTAAIAFGDVDGDGDQNLACAKRGFTQNQLLLNDGNGAFTDVTVTHMPVDYDDTIALALGDIDGDGDLDLICANNAHSASRTGCT